MEVSFQLTQDDYLLGLAAWRTSSGWRRWSYRLGIAALAALVVGSAGLMIWNPKLAQFWWPVIGLGVLCLLFIWIGPQLQARMQFRRMPSAQDPTTLIVTDSGMQTRSSHYTSQVGWSTYIAWAEGKSIFVILPQPRIYVPIPKRAFTAEQQGEFRELLQRNIKPQAR